MRRAFISALCLTLLACDGDHPAAPGDGVAGTFLLRRVDGAALPTTYLETPGYRLDVTGGSVVLRSDGTCVDTTRYRRTQDGVVEHPVAETACTYTVSGGTVALRYARGVLTAALHDGTLTFVEDGTTWEYAR